MVTPGARWPRESIGAQEPTSTWLSTIVSSPIHAPTLTNDGGMITTPSPSLAPDLTLVPPGTIRHGPPAARSRGGAAPRSLNHNGPPRRPRGVPALERA